VNLGLREVVWLLAGFLGLYAVMQLGRLRGLQRARRTPPPRPEAAPEFGLELEVQRLRREVGLLQEALASADGAWQAGQQHLEAEVLRLREALAAVQAEHSVSPHYGEAMILARRGLGAEAIAERCGISVAEAALVRSLAQRGESRPGEAA
jgi:DNA-directed RNA polymerase specialized sigma24 family protein